MLKDAKTTTLKKKKQVWVISTKSGKGKMKKVGANSVAIKYIKSVFVNNFVN